MKIIRLRRVGGAVRMAVPPAMLEELNLAAGSVVGIDIVDGRLVVQRRPLKYTAEELLAQCVGDQKLSEEEREWMDAPPVGREMI